MFKILIVDDDAVNRLFVKEVLHRHKPEYECFLATGGKEALEMVEAIPPDIILLDVLMPDMTGFDVCKMLKADDRFFNIPVLLITGLDTIDQKVAGFRLGAADYITKPISVDELCARVESHLRIKKYHDELAAANCKLIQTQSVLVENAKMSAVGSLAAGVAHEFNNILLMMGGNVQLYTDSDSLDELKGAIKIIGDLVERGERIVKGLLDFARKDEYQEKVSVNICDLINQDLTFMKKEINQHGIIVETNFKDVPDIDCYPGQVSQVFINILKNAVDSLKRSEKKQITIEVVCCDKKEMPCFNSECDLSQDWLVVCFRDTGCGIPDLVKDKILEPFVTTKGVVGGGNNSAPGTGLGLSISYGIMQRHKGSIQFKGNEDGGTSVYACFPINDDD